MLTAYRRSPEVIALAEAGKSSSEIADATGKGRAVVTDILWRAGYRWRWKMFGQIGSRRQWFREKARMEILNQPGRWKQKARRVAASLRRAGQSKGFRINVLQRWFQEKQVCKAWVKLYYWPTPECRDFWRGTFEAVKHVLEEQSPQAFPAWRDRWVLPDDPQEADFAFASWVKYDVLFVDEELLKESFFHAMIHGPDKPFDFIGAIRRKVKDRTRKHGDTTMPVVPTKITRLPPFRS
jgi:hypothetical protein